MGRHTCRPGVPGRSRKGGRVPVCHVTRRGLMMGWWSNCQVPAAGLLTHVHSTPLMCVCVCAVDWTPSRAAAPHRVQVQTSAVQCSACVPSRACLCLCLSIPIQDRRTSDASSSRLRRLGGRAGSGREYIDDTPRRRSSSIVITVAVSGPCMHAAWHMIECVASSVPSHD